MFKRREPERGEPRLLGDDFDIFPDLGGMPAEADEALEAVEEEPVEEEPPEPTPFQKRIADIPDDKWKLYQLLGGIAIGVLAALPISFLSRIEGISSFGLIFSVLLAMLLPNQFERRANRRIPRLRIAMIISLTAVFGLYLLYGFVLNPAYFAAP